MITKRSELEVIDTHTGGEPTRVVTGGMPELQGASLTEKRSDFQQRLDDYRRAIISEPRGSEVMVGALVLPPEQEGSAASVIFFNNVGYLGMCGHGMMGVAVALKELSRVDLGIFSVDTPVGTVQVNLLNSNRVQLENVESFRVRGNVPLALDSGQKVHGDIAWGGNWFYLCSDHGIDITKDNLNELTNLSLAIRRSLSDSLITGFAGAEIDHIELIGPPSNAETADAKGFVLCPGGAYDRSPCGTGTSAKIACLAADGKIDNNRIHRQESVIGSIFEATYRASSSEQPLPESIDGVRIVPTLTGTAFVNARTTMILDPADPFAMGIA